MSQALNFILLLVLYILASIGIILFVNSEYILFGLIILTGGFLTAILLKSTRFISQKIDLKNKEVTDNIDNTYRQVESLFSIYSTLNIEFILPPFRGWAISPDFATLILLKMKEKNPTNILECGSGISTVLIASKLKRGKKGHLYSFEHDEEYAVSTLDLLKRHELEKYVTIINTKLVEHSINGGTWKWYDVSQMDESVKFDMVVVDGPPFHIQSKARYPTLPLLDKSFNPNAVVLIDDCSREQDNEVINDWLAEFDYYDSEWFETEKGAYALTKHKG